MAQNRVGFPCARGQIRAREWRGFCEEDKPMDSNKLTQMSRQAVTDAQALARRLQHNEVDTWHLLSALLGQENGIVPGLLDKMAITPSALQLAVDRELERLPKVSGNVDTSKAYITSAVNEVLTKAEEEAKSLKDE